MTGGSFTGRSSLYHADSDDLYYLFLTMPDMDTVRRMQNVLAILSEYGTSLKITYASEQHLKEHSRILCENDALSRLAEL
jgi:negative regulator of genetic competence, sporulation and motility